MGRLCAVCGHSRPHEQFGGRGERAVVCRECRRQPREQRARVLLTGEILGFLDQSNISAKNIRRLEKLEAEALEDVAVLAALVNNIAQISPRKRNRWKLLKQQHPTLYRLSADAGLIDDLEPEQFGECHGDAFDEEEADLDGWIIPRRWEVEPTAEDVRAASNG